MTINYRSITQLIILIISFAGSQLMFAQESEFKSIDELHNAYVENENRIRSQSELIKVIQSKQKNKKKEISNYRPIYLESTITVSIALDNWNNKLANKDPNNPVLSTQQARELERIYYDKLREYGKKKQKLDLLREDLQRLYQSEFYTYKKLNQYQNRRLK